MSVSFIATNNCNVMHESSLAAQVDNYYIFTLVFLKNIVFQENVCLIKPCTSFEIFLSLVIIY